MMDWRSCIVVEFLSSYFDCAPIKNKMDEEGGGKQEGVILCPILMPNAFSGDLCVSLSHFEHPRLENTVIY